ncbi:MAG: hypothetical protein JWS10_3904 [Cypionkella sp.]|nr:hypothetical protein [Cypionkella sp.]
MSYVECLRNGLGHVIKMEVIANKNETFILLNGISTPKNIQFCDGVQLEQADTSQLDFASAVSTCSRPDDIAVVAAFIPRITSQFRINASSPREVSIIAWNSSWDALLLSAIFQAEIGFNIQSDTTANQISSNSSLRGIHRQMSGFNDAPPYIITGRDVDWLSRYFGNARSLLGEDSFQTAVQCLATYHWHPNPRVKLAMIWAGIEGIFGASSEIRFRISVCIARFLHADDELERKNTFEIVKRLYNVRSKAVHGAKSKGELSLGAIESANLLNKLLIRSIETGLLPVEADLFP